MKNAGASRNTDDIRIKTQKTEGKKGGEQRSAQQRAMRKIDNVQDAVDQRQSESNQCIDCADQQAVDDRRDQDGGRQHDSML